MKRRPGRGGARPGAGRPPAPLVRTTSHTIQLTPSLLARLDAYRARQATTPSLALACRDLLAYALDVAESLDRESTRHLQITP